jgi:hypothetical protein
MLRRKLQKYWNETQNDNLPVSNVMNSW